MLLATRDNTALSNRQILPSNCVCVLLKQQPARKTIQLKKKRNELNFHQIQLIGSLRNPGCPFSTGKSPTLAAAAAAAA